MLPPIVLAALCEPLLPRALSSPSAKPPHDHPDGMQMPLAKVGSDLLKTVAVHKEQTRRFTFCFMLDISARLEILLQLI